MLFARISNTARCAGALVLAALVLQGCDQPRAAGSSTRLYAIDQSGGAKVCNAPTAKPVANQTIDAAMTVSNDGGWCGLIVSNNGHPFDAGLLTVRPKGGKVYIHPVGDATRVDYTPNAGFTGSDVFAFRLLPGQAGVRVNVTVNK